MAKHTLYKGAFEALGLPFFEDSVGGFSSADRNKMFDANHQDANKNSPSFQLVEALHKGLSDVDLMPEYRQEDAIYYGNFTLLDNPKTAVVIAEKRNKALKAILSDLRDAFRVEEDEEIQTKIKSIISQTEQKIVLSYDDYKEKFSQSSLNDIKLLIQDNERNEREEIQEYKRDNYRSSAGYVSRYSSNIKGLRDDIRERERFISQNKNSPEGYFKHLQSTVPPTVFSFFLKQLRARVPERVRKKHSYIVAESGSGKSELIKALIYPEVQKINKPTRSIILIDPHGDIAEQVANFKEFNTPEGRDRLVYIDPTAKDGFSPSINPFYLKKTDEKTVGVMTQELKRILSVLLSGAGTTAQMDAILSPCISTLLWKKDSDFKELQRFFDDNNNADLIALGCQNPNPEHKSLFLSKFQDDSYRATKHGIYTRIQILLNDPIFQKLISSKTTIDLKKLTEEKKIIIFKLPLGEVGSESVEAFGRFVVGMMRVIALQRASIDESQRTPIDLYIDEFQNFVSADIETALTQLRKYGLYLTLAHQFVGQGNIDTNLQKAMFASGLIVVGSNDSKSLKTISNEINVAFENLQDLPVGNFYIKAGKNPAFRVIVPVYLLKYGHAMKREEFAEIMKDQVKKYYARPRAKVQDQEQQEKTYLSDEIQQNQDVKSILSSYSESRKTSSKFQKEPKKKLKPKYDL